MVPVQVLRPVAAVQGEAAIVGYLFYGKSS
jgi:hypothetical protein